MKFYTTYSDGTSNSFNNLTSANKPNDNGSNPIKIGLYIVIYEETRSLDL